MHYRCPYCMHDQTVERPNFSREFHRFSRSVRGPYAESSVGAETIFILCQNPDCSQFSFTVRIRGSGGELDQSGINGGILLARRLTPPSTAQVWPDYVPAHLRRAYEQACAIVDLSPEASATMSRRCLQGMIRDRWPEQVSNLPRKRLFDEINALLGSIDAESWGAIDAVRTMGNVGAHFEADTNQIIEIDPGEAEQLIKLLELLVDDWYVQRARRQLLLAEVQETAARKESERAGEAN